VSSAIPFSDQVRPPVQALKPETLSKPGPPVNVIVSLPGNVSEPAAPLTAIPAGADPCAQVAIVFHPRTGSPTAPRR
jgi:hypothetical protein